MAERLPWWERALKRLNVNRISRAQLHYDAIRGGLSQRTSRERDEASFFCRKFERYAARAQRLLTIRLLFSAILYASIVVNVLQVIPILSFLVEFIEFGSAIIGTGVAFLIFMFLTMKINLYLQLMNQSLMHLTVLYHANPKRDTDKTIRALRKTL